MKMKMFLPKGTTLLITSLAIAASAAVGRVAADDVDPSSTGELLPKYVPYDTKGITTLLVSYSDEKGHDNVVSHTKKMKGQGKSVSEKKNFKLKTKHKVKKAKSSSNDGSKKGAKAGKTKDVKDRKLNLFDAEKEDKYISGFSVIEVESDDVAAEIAALSALPGVTTVEEDSMMHILSTDYDKKKKLRGEKGGVAEHVREIQDSIKTTADEIGDVSSSHHGERRLAEETPYGIDMVNAEYVWNKGAPQSTIKICVVDTGYDLGHEDLPTASDGVEGWGPGGAFGLWDEDGNGHGTHCAGTIGAIGNNGIGVTSVNPDPDRFTFFIGKGLSNSGSGSAQSVMDSVRKCVENGAKVISMSLGCDDCYTDVENALYEDTYDAGGELRSTVSAYCNAQPPLTHT